MEAGTLAKRFAGEVRILGSQGRWIEALVPARKAAECDPTSVQAALELGVLLTKLGRLQEAEQELRRGLSLDPDSAPLLFSLSQNLLAEGRYSEGWPLYREKERVAGLSRGVPRNFPFPRWKGESLSGKHLVIFPEQGLGDQIQFVRFLPQLQRVASSITLLTWRSLERLFRANFPGVKIMAAEGNVEFQDPDYWAMLTDLPAACGLDLNAIPSDPYLISAAAWPSLGDGFKIGLKARGNPDHLNDKQRSLPAEYAAGLGERLPGRLISLEPEESGAADMADTAAIVDQLDLVVSVDTSVAHLAGAMGKPCLLLVPGFGPDWRWMVGRDDSPWYPHHRLFRGTTDGEWQGAVDRVVAEAEKLARASSQPVAAKGDAALAALMLRAKALRDEARFSEALDLMRRARRQAPDNPAPPNILGTMLSDVGRLDEAEMLQRRAVALRPDYAAFRYDLGITLLAQGRYDEGWPLYQARSEIPSLKIAFPKGIAKPRWRGEELAGKRLTIMPEQGFGDAIQFARFLPRLRERDAQVRLYVQPALVALFRSSFPGIEILAAEGQVRLGNPDFWTTLIDMAGPLGVAPHSLPRPPYLRTDRTWPALGDGFKIGLQTRGNPQHANDAWRSLPARDAEALRAALSGQVIDLDPASSGARDFADTAALILQLDLIVSVDTSVAHLAGALGKPCLLLVPGIATDWRWMRDRADSPWYPRHKLYRSALDGNWKLALERLVADADALRIALGGTAA